LYLYAHMATTAHSLANTPSGGGPSSLTALHRAFAPFILRAHRGRHFELPARTPHPGGCWMMVMVVEGVLEWFEAGVRREVLPEMILMVPPATRGKLRPNSACWVRGIEFDLVYRERSLSSQHFWRPTQNPAARQPSFSQLFGVRLPRLWKPDGNQALVNFLRTITDTWWRGELEAFYANNELSRMIEALLRTRLREESANSVESHPLSAAEGTARAGFSHGCTVEDMARAVGMTRAAFSRAYKRWRGIPPGQYLRDLRYQQAKELLKDPNFPMWRVLRASGFRSKRSFLRSFRLREGLSPAAWRCQVTGE